eukprot:NODE_142_length_17801_cov_0.377020.p4 type:complete len:578 gc:universal NODE_142_length_17801_cov_0.377020:557-2290(+)
MKVGNCVALHLSPNKDQVVLASKDQLSLFSLFHNMEYLNLTTKLPTKNLYSYLDVKWTPQNYIVGCCANGSLIVFNIHKAGSNKLERIFHEHVRSVNKLDCHSVDPLIISGSLDGTCRLWDLRVKNKSIMKFDVKEACRDVCFYSLDEFSAIQDDGNIYRFDTRQPNLPLQILSAHSGSGLTLSYTNGLLASGARDKTIKIWDIHNDVIKPLSTIYLDNIPGKVSWKENSRILATVSLQNQGDLLVWDTSIPHVPIYTITPHSDTIVDFVWAKENDMIFSVAKDCEFRQTLYTSGQNPRKYFPKATTAWSNYQEIAIFHEASKHVEQVNDSFFGTLQTKIGLSADSNTGLPITVSAVASELHFYAFENELELFVYYSSMLDLEDLKNNISICTDINDEISASHFELLYTLVVNKKDSDDYVQSTIHHYFYSIIDELADENIQLAAITFVLLRNYVTMNKRILAICQTYLKKLKTLKLFTACGRFIKSCRVEELQRISLSTTRLMMSCGRCDKSFQVYNKGICEHCSHCYNICSICKQHTDGLVSGCMECGHIAHIECFKNWFDTHIECPTGCGCHCK